MNDSILPSLGKVRIIGASAGQYTVEIDGQPVNNVVAYKLDGATDCLHELTLTVQVAEVEVEAECVIVNESQA